MALNVRQYQNLSEYPKSRPKMIHKTREGAQQTVYGWTLLTDCISQLVLGLWQKQAAECCDSVVLFTRSQNRTTWWWHPAIKWSRRDIVNITLWRRSPISLANSSAAVGNDEAAMLEGHRDIVYQRSSKIMRTWKEEYTENILIVKLAKLYGQRTHFKNLFVISALIVSISHKYLR